MAKDVSIAFKASDNLTHSIQQMRKSVGGLSRDVSEYRKIQSDAFDRKTEVKIDITKAKRELKELERAVKENTEGSEKAFKEKQRAIEDLQEEYRRLSKAAQEAGKAERQLQDDVSRSSNANASRMSSEKAIMSNLAGAGLGNMVGGAMSTTFNQSITSMFGSTTGNAIGGVVGGVASGAAMGSVAGPVGAAVGAAVGGLTSAITALSDIKEKEDDLFRNEVNNIYDKVNNVQQESLDNGIGLSSRYEQNMISFGTLLKGEENASKFLEDVQIFSRDTPFETESLLNTSKTLLTYGYTQDEIIPLMTDVGNTGSALGMSSADMNVVSESLGRMKASNKASLEYLNPLIERGIPAVDYLAESLGKSKEEVYDLVSKGLIPGEKAAEMIAKYMGKDFAGNMELQSQTFEGMSSSLRDMQSEIDKAMGMGYTEERKKGMEKELAMLDGEIGGKMKEANKLIGQFEADLENKYQQAIIDATIETQQLPEYIKAMEEGNGAEMGRLLAASRAAAESNFQNTEGMQIKRENEMALVQSIQKDVALNNEYVDFGMQMADQFSKGYSGVINDGMNNGLFSPPEQSKVIQEKGNLWQKTQDKFSGQGSNSFGGIDLEEFKENGFATGLPYVPSDGYRYVHEGEQILTKVDANKNRSGGMGDVIIPKLADQLIIREEADIDKIARALASKLMRARETYSGGVV